MSIEAEQAKEIWVQPGDPVHDGQTEVLPPVSGDGAGGGGTGGGAGGGGPTTASDKRPNYPGGLPGNATTAVTRLMCATAYLQAPFADDVSGTLLDPTAHALVPNWGVDNLALIRNVVRSRRKRIARDGQLGFVFVTSLVLIALSLGLTPTRAVSVVQAGVFLLLIVVAAWVVGFVIVFMHYDWIRTSALDMMNADLNPLDIGTPLDEEDEARMVALNNANVVVFPSYNPFVGFGHPLDTWNLTFDLQPAPGEEQVREFTPMDVHRHLLRDLKERTPDLWTGDIMFGNGATVEKLKNPDGSMAVIPDPRVWTDWPASRVPQEVVERYVNKPEENHRTYAVLARTCWRGEIVVFALIRADRDGRKVFVEGRTHVLLPLRGTFREVKYAASFSRRTFTQVFWPALKNTHWLLVGGLRRRMRRAYNIKMYIYEMKKLTRRLNRGDPHNYGVATSIREQAQAPEAMKYYATVDEVMYYRVLTRQMMSSLDHFLTGQGADLTEFRRQANEVINRTEVMLNDASKVEAAFGPQKTVRHTERGTMLQTGLGGPDNPGL
ncbi:MAG TPA: hypothetical protein VFP72_11560 [Kineosporiaceae bacterium]|nr:hypothetical protein [Kineosporiaceae bacterium]